MAVEELYSFTNIDFPTVQEPSYQYGQQSFSNMADFSAGMGDSCFRMDPSGMWLGAKKFANAPFRVDMLGNTVVSSMVITGGQVSYGKTSFSDSTHAGYFISSSGIYFGSAADASRLKYTISSGVLDLIGTISGRNTATVASAIDSVGNLITSSFNTSTKQILDGFSFGTSGALQIGTYSAGVTGDIRISPNGIVGRNKSNITTFSIDGSTGDATFGGTLVAASGTFGTITAGTFTGVTVQTGTTGQRVVISGNNFKAYDSSNVIRVQTADEGIRVTDYTGTSNVDISTREFSGPAGVIWPYLLVGDTSSPYNRIGLRTSFLAGHPTATDKSLRLYLDGGSVTFRSIGGGGTSGTGVTLTSPDDNTLTSDGNKFSLNGMILEKSGSDLLCNGVKIN